MTYSKFRRTMINGGWSCYDNGISACFSRGWADVVVETDTDSYDDGYVSFGYSCIDISDIRYIHFYPDETVFILWSGYQSSYSY